MDGQADLASLDDIQSEENAKWMDEEKSSRKSGK